MKLFIEASNIRNGGGVTHLVEILNCLTDKQDMEITVVSNNKVLDMINNDSVSIKKLSHPYLNGSFAKIILWRMVHLQKDLNTIKPDLVFSPAGNFTHSSIPYVSMCRNMLLYDQNEMDRYGGFSKMKLKLSVLRRIQLKSFKEAQGVIFLSQYAKTSVNHYIDLKNKNTEIINHGISTKFEGFPKKQRTKNEITSADPYRLLYVSNWSVYKHHLNLIKAVRELNGSGLYIQLILIGGPTHQKSFEEAQEYISKHKIGESQIKVMGKVDYSEIHEFYHTSEGFIYASTCENMPNILIEAMSSGLPIICSKSQPMPEFLEDGGLYFDPENIEDIKTQLLTFVESKDLRESLSQKSKSLSEQYSWEKCAKETFDFLKMTYESYKK